MSRTELPDFPLFNIPKQGRKHQIATKLPNGQEICIPNGHKIYQRAIKYTKWPVLRRFIEQRYIKRRLIEQRLIEKPIHENISNEDILKIYQNISKKNLT
jgi:hypothetical protein